MHYPVHYTNIECFITCISLFAYHRYRNTYLNDAIFHTRCIGTLPRERSRISSARLSDILDVMSENWPLPSAVLLIFLHAYRIAFRSSISLIITSRQYKYACTKTVNRIRSYHSHCKSSRC